MPERTLTLLTGQFQFNKASVDWKHRALVLSWYAETDVLNIAALRVIVFGFRWPPVKWITRFTDAQ